MSLSYSHDQFGTIQNLQRALIPQTSNCSGTIFAVSCSKLGIVYCETQILKNVFPINIPTVNSIFCSLPNNHFHVLTTYIINQNSTFWGKIIFDKAFLSLSLRNYSNYKSRQIEDPLSKLISPNSAIESTPYMQSFIIKLIIAFQVPMSPSIAVQT